MNEVHVFFVVDFISKDIDNKVILSRKMEKFYG